MDKNVIFIILWVFVTAVCISMECDYSFVFPTLNASVLSVEENTNISLRFEFVSTCGLPDDLRINVAKTQASIRTPICQILQANGTCTVHAIPEAQCQCLSDNGTYLLSKEAERDDNTTWIWWTTGENETETELVFNIIDSSTSTIAPLATTDETDNQSEFFYTQNLIILFAVAGFGLLAIFACIFVYAKAGRGTANFIARMRQEVLAEALPRRPSVDLGVAPSIELIWDSRDPRYQPARRAAKRSRAAIPFVQENADTRPKSIISENIYHEIGEHADDGELPQNDSQSNPQPSMDEDGYLAPRDLIRQGAAKQM